MLVVKAHTVSFDLVDGDKFDAPARDGMMHDEQGKSWRRNSVLVGPYDRDAIETDKTIDYLGSGYLVHAGDTRLPPKPLNQWVYLGEVERIWYTRHGARQGGKRFQHQFNKISIAKLIKGTGRARLYSYNRWYRLELPRNLIADRRGFVFP